MYVKIGEKANELYDLGMNYSNIGKALGVNEQTAKKAILSYQERMKQARECKAYSHGQARLYASVNGVQGGDGDISGEAASLGEYPLDFD